MFVNHFNSTCKTSEYEVLHIIGKRDDLINMLNFKFHSVEAALYLSIILQQILEDSHLVYVNEEKC